MNRKTILAFVLIGAVLVLMPYYYSLVAPEKTKESVGETGRFPSDSEIQADSTAIEPKTIKPVVPLSGQGASSLESIPDSFDQQAQLDDETTAKIITVNVETPLFRAQFNTKGATITSWIVKPVQPYLHDSEQLVRIDGSGNNLVLTARGGRGLLRTGEMIFDVNRGRLILDSFDAPRNLVFTLPLGHDKFYRETYTFYADRYSFDLKIESRGLGELSGAAEVLFSWGGGLASTENDTIQDLYYTEASYLMGRTKERVKTNGKKVIEEFPTGPTKWVAQRTKYFLLALVPEEPAEGAMIYSWPDTSYIGKHPPKLFDTGLVFNVAGGDLREKITVYLGPLEQSFVTAVDPTLEQTMSWGWAIIKPFSKLTLWALKALHVIIPNYGLVLIIFSVLVKVIVWPLTQKSHKSMKRMQLLQPKLKAIQEKYKGNQQRTQQEVMALYKEHKVNPMGGCWPMLLQMPLLYSLFIVFRSTIELRGQPFILWIKDLSMPDVLIALPFTIPLYGDGVCVLPLIMAASTYLQSKSTMTDPNQKAMLYFMPIMFIFLFNNFPSGLTLYYTLFNLLSWGQQKLMKIQDPSIEKTLDEVKQNKKKSGQRRGGKGHGRRR